MSQEEFISSSIKLYYLKPYSLGRSYIETNQLRKPERHGTHAKRIPQFGSFQIRLG